MNRKYVLKRNEEIGDLVKRNNKIGNRYYNVYFYESISGPRLAVSVSKKYGNAVKRNYEKRVTREIMREIIPSLPNIDVLIVIKKELNKINFLEKKNQLNYLFNKIMKNIGDKKRERE